MKVNGDPERLLQAFLNILDNGTITASSVPGRGATFTIQLPITKD